MRSTHLVAGTVVCAAIGIVPSSFAAPQTSGVVAAADKPRTSLAVSAVDKEPKDSGTKPGAAKLAELRKAVDDAPNDRARRFDLVRALMAEGDLPSALKEAQAWRAKDAYDLLVVRLIGDLHLALGDPLKARRTYSSVVELLPKDAEAHRALASVLKQGGDLEGAYGRLRDASKLRPDDARLAFELADVAHRLGRDAEAETRLSAIVGDGGAPASIRHPAKQRLAQIWAKKRRAAVASGDAVEASRLAKAIADLGIQGGVENDLKVYLTWDADKTDVDLWVETPSGQRVWYQKKVAPGGALYDDVTSGYGPESFTAKNAEPGTYVVKVDYFGTSRTAFTDARGEVVVITHEGTKDETRAVFPYHLWKPKQTVTVAKIVVGEAKVKP